MNEKKEELNEIREGKDPSTAPPRGSAQDDSGELRGCDGRGGIRKDADGNVADWGITGPPGEPGAPIAEDEEETPTTLTEDIVRAIRRELERNRARSGDAYHSAFEAWGVLIAALEEKDAINKDLKNAQKELWDGVKNENDDVVAAFLNDIGRVARESAGAWIRVAAIAKKAGESL